jgi:hypothetical protein
MTEMPRPVGRRSAEERVAASRSGLGERVVVEGRGSGDTHKALLRFVEDEKGSAVGRLWG